MKNLEIRPRSCAQCFSSSMLSKTSFSDRSSIRIEMPTLFVPSKRASMRSQRTSSSPSPIENAGSFLLRSITLFIAHHGLECLVRCGPVYPKVAHVSIAHLGPLPRASFAPQESLTGWRPLLRWWAWCRVWGVGCSLRNLAYCPQSVLEVVCSISLLGTKDSLAHLSYTNS